MELEKQDNIDQHTFQFREDNEALVAKIRPAETVTPSASFIEETRRRLLRLGRHKEASRRRAA